MNEIYFTKNNETDAYQKIFGTSMDPKLMNTVIILHAFKNPDNFLKVLKMY